VTRAQKEKIKSNRTEVNLTIISLRLKLHLSDPS